MINNLLGLGLAVLIWMYVIASAVIIYHEIKKQYFNRNKDEER